jgi:endonuclease/exonuclease/phosphatase family metal-dependent hydrolase
MKKIEYAKLIRNEIGVVGFAIVLILIFLTACAPGCVLQGVEERIVESDIIVMSWNVENLFDGVDNGTEYREFDPGEGNWDTSRYHTRLSAVGRVISEFIDPIPDIICLQEIEHSGVVNDLLKWNLKQYGFNYSAVTENDNSAIQTGIISRFPITRVRVHNAAVTGSAGYSLRPVLEAEILIGDESIIILNNHWKSRIGGAENTELLRIASADVVRRILHRTSIENPDMLIICAGDLNENANEYERAGELYQTALMPQTVFAVETQSLMVTGSVESVSDDLGILYNPWLDSNVRYVSEGSYCYRNEWCTLDHLMVSEAAFDQVGLDFLSFTPFVHPWMLHASGAPVGWDIRSGEGYSDHLPILLTLTPAPLISK